MGGSDGAVEVRLAGGLVFGSNCLVCFRMTDSTLLGPDAPDELELAPDELELAPDGGGALRDAQWLCSRP